MIVTHRPLEPCRTVAIPWCCRSWGIRRLRSWRRTPSGERPGGISGATRVTSGWRTDVGAGTIREPVRVFSARSNIRRLRALRM